jgi:hypothetical protein
MSCCNSYPTCQSALPAVCETFGITNEATGIVVEDISFCSKVLENPTTPSALQYTASSLIKWNDGSSDKPFSLPNMQGATGATGYAGIIGIKSNGDFVSFQAATGATGATGYEVVANDGDGWKVVSGAAITGVSDQPKGGGSNRVFFENDIIVTDNYTITTNKNALTAGPITVASGVTVTVPPGSTWTVV